MATLLVDPRPASPDEQKPAEGNITGAQPSPTGTVPAQAPSPRSCAKCGGAMVEGQDWCLHCGAGAPGSLDGSSWRPAATAIGAAVVLALGAAAAGYAALSKGTAKPAVKTTTVAQTTPPAVTGTPPVTTPTTPFTTPTAPTIVKPAIPFGKSKPPKIPLTAPTPKTTGGSTGANINPDTTNLSSAGGSTPHAPKPTPILLDTNAASTYNPYNYPASQFGDPSLTIDGDTSTGWTALVDPTNAPRMAEGVLINLKSRQKLAAVQLVSSTPGITVQVYGSNSHTVPASITDPAWVALSRARVVKKRHAHIALRHSEKAFTLMTLWISRAPESAVGTPEAPGRVSVNEIELLPTS